MTTSTNIIDPNEMTQRLAQERAAVETLYRAFNEHNPELVNDVLVESWDDVPLGPGQPPGRDGIKPIILSFAAALPDVQITVKDMIQEPGRIGVRAEITGTHRGELFGVAPTGKALRFAIHEFHTLDAGRITHTWHLEDWFGCFMQIGRFPGAPA